MLKINAKQNGCHTRMPDPLIDGKNSNIDHPNNRKAKQKKQGVK